MTKPPPLPTIPPPLPVIPPPSRKTEGEKAAAVGEGAMQVLRQQHGKEPDAVEPVDQKPRRGRRMTTEQTEEIRAMLKPAISVLLRKYPMSAQMVGYYARSAAHAVLRGSVEQ